MFIRRLLVAVAAGLCGVCGAASAWSQERLHLETMGDEALHRLTFPDEDKPILWRLDGHAGLEADVARGASPAPAWPFAFTEDLGFGLRHGLLDTLQIFGSTVVPFPVAPSGHAGSWSTWDLEFADRVHGQLALGGFDDAGRLEATRGGIDLSVDGTLNQSGRSSTLFLRRDVGPLPFIEGVGRVTIAPRLNLNDNAALVLPTAAEVHGVDVNRPIGDATYTAERVSSGFGVKPVTREVSHGLVEFIGFGWETVGFTPARVAPPPRFAGVERVDFRLAHLDALSFRLDNSVEGELSSNLGGNWLHDLNGQASLSTVAGSLGLSMHGSPQDNLERSRFGAGLGVIYDGIYLADGSALTRRARYEAFMDGYALDQRVGASVRAAVEELVDVDRLHDRFRGAIAAEWFVAPIKELELGADFTSTQQCASAAAAAGPAWCQRFGIFVRLAVHRATRRADPPVETPEPEPAAGAGAESTPRR